jgi:hypothetical protein
MTKKAEKVVQEIARRGGTKTVDDVWDLIIAQGDDNEEQFAQIHNLFSVHCDENDELEARVTRLENRRRNGNSDTPSPTKEDSTTVRQNWLMWLVGSSILKYVVLVAVSAATSAIVTSLVLRAFER